MIKITEIEGLLNLKQNGEITLREIQKDTLYEVARYFGAVVSDSVFFDSTTIKRNNMTVTLHGEIKPL